MKVCSIIFIFFPNVLILFLLFTFMMLQTGRRTLKGTSGSPPPPLHHNNIPIPFNSVPSSPTPFPHGLPLHSHHFSSPSFPTSQLISFPSTLFPNQLPSLYSSSARKENSENKQIFSGYKRLYRTSFLRSYNTFIMYCVYKTVYWSNIWAHTT